MIILTQIKTKITQQAVKKQTNKTNKQTKQKQSKTICNRAMLQLGLHVIVRKSDLFWNLYVWHVE